ncbi:MAG: hypothetical protein GOP50_11910 [Candidatus Heimdallarchaeota archaeon]|nr:hypothetical protein [Candidatus Heimdallarchaeota archaeon]
MKKKVSYTILILTLSLVLTNSQSILQVNSEPYGIYSIELAPNPIVYGQNMSVRIQFDCVTNITTAKLFIYKITEDMICACDYVYVQMYEIPSFIECADAVRYEGNYTVDFPIGMQIGYRIMIFYENVTIQSVPDVENFMGIDTIEPLNNEIMFDAGKVQQSSEATGLTYLSFIGPVLLISVILVRKRRIRVNHE